MQLPVCTFHTLTTEFSETLIRVELSGENAVWITINAGVLLEIKSSSECNNSSVNVDHSFILLSAEDVARIWPFGEQIQ